MQQSSETAGGARRSPVDNYTYDLLQALTSKLEAIEAYEMYAEDEGEGGGGAGIFQELAEQDRRQADRLLGELRRRLAGEGSQAS